METLSFQDAALLRFEAPQHPFHVGGLMIFEAPAGARRGHLRRLVERLARALPEADPLFLRTLDPAHPSAPRWLRATDFDPTMHLHHYALPAGAGMDDLLRLVSRAHERLLDRSRPLWEWHLIEGLPGKRFALYCKIHHALIDGVGALRLLTRLLGRRAGDDRLARRAARAAGVTPAEPPAVRGVGWLGDLAQGAQDLLEQGRALPELAAMLLRMGREGGEAGSPPLPFTAPRTPMNQNVSVRRRIVIADLPIAGLKRVAAAELGTLNDAFLALCGGALRSYLQEQGALPRQTLLAGVPVSVKDPGVQHGNQLSTIVCPLETGTQDPLRRLRAIVRVTSRAKQDLRALSQTARQDYMNLILVPTMVLTLAHAATALPPPFNVLISNVPGPTEPLYLAGARLHAVYPLSVLNDAQALNITGVGCGPRLCVAATACPDSLPGIERFDRHLRQAWKELREATQREPRPSDSQGSA